MTASLHHTRITYDYILLSAIPPREQESLQYSDSDRMVTSSGPWRYVVLGVWTAGDADTYKTAALAAYEAAGGAKILVGGRNARAHPSGRRLPTARPVQEVIASNVPPEAIPEWAASLIA